MMSDVNLERLLVVKGWRSDGSLHNGYYHKFKNEHTTPMGQGSCQVLEIFQGSEGGRGAVLR